MMYVDIILATFNGEQYIRPLIFSILSQSFRNWNLIIHDDGSSDNTVTIIKEMIKIDARIRLVDDGIKCGAAANNFMHLLKYSTSTYCMFCDQDDIWFDNKIEIMLNAISRRSNEFPVVLYSNSYVWIPYQGIAGQSTFVFPKNIRQFLFLNSGMQGCVSIFNKKMKEYLLDWKCPCAMHDHLLHLLGLTVGEVEYLHLPLMLYRQHEHNVTGYTAVTKHNVKQIFINNALPVVNKEHYDVVSNFYDKYSNEISNSDAKLMNDYLSFPSKSKMKVLLMIIVDRFQLYGSILRLILKIIIRPYIK